MIAIFYLQMLKHLKVKDGYHVTCTLQIVRIPQKPSQAPAKVIFCVY